MRTILLWAAILSLFPAVAMAQDDCEGCKDHPQKYLAGKGVDAKRLSTKGWGDTKPVGDNRTEDGRTQNRRVELVKT